MAHQPTLVPQFYVVHPQGIPCLLQTSQVVTFLHNRCTHQHSTCRMSAVHAAPNHSPVKGSAQELSDAPFSQHFLPSNVVQPGTLDVCVCVCMCAYTCLYKLQLFLDVGKHLNRACDLLPELDQVLIALLNLLIQVHIVNLELLKVYDMQPVPQLLLLVGRGGTNHHTASITLVARPLTGIRLCETSSTAFYTRPSPYIHSPHSFTFFLMRASFLAMLVDRRMFSRRANTTSPSPFRSSAASCSNS